MKLFWDAQPSWRDSELAQSLRAKFVSVHLSHFHLSIYHNDFFMIYKFIQEFIQIPSECLWYESCGPAPLCTSLLIPHKCTASISLHSLRCALVKGPTAFVQSHPTMHFSPGGPVCAPHAYWENPPKIPLFQSTLFCHNYVPEASWVEPSMPYPVCISSRLVHVKVP